MRDAVKLLALALAAACTTPVTENVAFFDVPAGSDPACIVHPLDLDPNFAGGQYDCSVYLIAPDNTSGAIVAPCSRQSNGCWSIVEGVCPAGFAEIQVIIFPPANRPHLRGECVVDSITLSDGMRTLRPISGRFGHARSLILRYSRWPHHCSFV